jgi:hypothetical protein
VVVAEREALVNVLLDGIEMAQDALAHRLEGLETIAGARCMAADSLAGAVVDGNERPGAALSQRHGFGHVGPPHHAHGGGSDGTIMGALRQPRNQVFGLPIRLPDSDGAPARVIAVEEDP